MMQKHGVIILSAAVALLLGACNRYETRPLEPRDCPPEPTSRDTAYFLLRPAPEAPGAIVGTVHAEYTGVALPKTWVRVRAASALVDGETDSAGEFRIDSLPVGRYVLELRHIAYRRRVDSVTISPGAGAIVRVVLQQQPTDGCPGFAMLVTKKPWWKWW